MGDLLSIDELPLPRKVKILEYESELGLLALDKPINFKSHPNKGGQVEKSTLLMAKYDFKGEFYDCDCGKIYLLNRLDSPTSGVILLASRDTTAKAVKELFKARKVKKTYMALVKGKLKARSGTWRDRLSKAGGGDRVRAGVTGDLEAQTDFEVLGYDEGFGVTFVKLTPKTGRTHQLRVQTAKRGHPIVGDKTYGDFTFNKYWAQNGGAKRLFLHAKEVELELEGKQFCVESELPQDFEV